MKVIVGLGNPGSQYAKTRHNVGFCVMDLLGTELGGDWKESRDFKAHYSKTKFKDDDIVVVKPLTYMNLSGQAVSAVVRWFKVDLKDVLVIHDDVSLPLGRIRVQNGGGAGGQHGIESIIECMGSKDFSRIKVGVGPDPGGALRASFVLSAVRPEQSALWTESLDLAKKAAKTWLKEGAEVTANRFNGKNLAEPEKPKEKKPKPEGLTKDGLPSGSQEIDPSSIKNENLPPDPNIDPPDENKPAPKADD
ncbi:MAG: aminoacyl-tRNA hydrolase [Candidatus Melainabacteria bacterium]|nr:aminoacyl-tRNA hydrolase [Candidatus Melainabacteria bacterium]